MAWTPHWDPEEVLAALEGRTTTEAASLLGMTRQTLHNRFGSLLTTRRSRLAPLPADLVDRLAVLAADPTMGSTRACRLLGITLPTLRAWLRLHHLVWVAPPRGHATRRLTRPGESVYMSGHNARH